MRCTSCSEEVRCVVAIDIDGTLGDFHGHFLRFAYRYLDKMYDLDLWESWAGVFPFRDWFCEMTGVSTATWKEIKLAYRQGGMKRTMPAYRQAENLVRYVMGQGAELWITTSRPAYRLDNIDPDTLEWCRRNRIGYDYVLYDDDKYERLAERVDPERVVAVLDDLGEMYDAAAVRFGPDIPILARSSWNRGVHKMNGVPVDTLAEPAQIIGERIFRWKIAHGMVMS